jgi:RNA polymerase sigma-70 factor (ECF subfamily)
MSSSIEERDRQWLRRMQGGDERAFEHLFLCYYDALCRFASRYVSSSDAVEDLVQDVFFSVWQRREALDPQQSLRAYLYKATRNEALKHLDRQERWPRAQREVRERSLRGQPGEKMQHNELKAEMWKALDALPDRRREVFLLSRRHELTYAEIAELLDISVKTVETQMGRALQFLEEQFPTLLSS